jgi:hypothetical protein
MKWKTKMLDDLEELDRQNNKLFLRSQQLIHLMPKSFSNDLLSICEQIKRIKMEIKDTDLSRKQ